VDCDQFAEIGEQRAALKAAGGGGRERAFGESLAVLALGAERDFSVDDWEGRSDPECRNGDKGE
jgi:hypothetical protein